MIRVRALSLVLPLAAALVPPGPAAALEADAGLRVAIFDENYKRGLGAELGLIHAFAPKADLGLHLEYTGYTAKTVDFEDVSEMGAHVTAYFRPALEGQPFEVRLGPHVGASRLREDWYADLGGDAMVVFKVVDRLKAYGAFIPSFLLGGEVEAIYRVGLGVNYDLGGSAPAGGRRRGSGEDREPPAGEPPAAPSPEPEPAPEPAPAKPEDGKPLPGYEEMP